MKLLLIVFPVLILAAGYLVILWDRADDEALGSVLGQNIQRRGL